MLRFFGFLVMVSVIVGVVLMLDFNSVRKAAEAAEQPVPDFQTYLSELQPRLTAMIAPSGGDKGPALTADLAAMLPRAPEGWTTRAPERGDADTFLPKETGTLEAEIQIQIEALAKAKGPKGSSTEALVYETEGKTVIIKAVRAPDMTFADPAMLAAYVKDRLPFPKTGYLRVRGLDVDENNLPDGMRGRLFTADIGGQIRLSVLTSKKVTDKDLLALFETLDVQALNAAVLDREAGLGEVPVLLLVSELDEAGLASYKADRTARDAERDARREALFAKLVEDAPSATTEDIPEDEAVVTCSKGAGGVKRCTVGD